MMGVRNGRNYIVSVSITPEMHDFINSRRKGSRSAFIRRAIYNAETYDAYNKKVDATLDDLEDQRNALLTLVAYQQARINRILSEGLDYPNFISWVLTDGSYSPMMEKKSWRDARDVIEELTHPIDALSNVLLALGDTGGGDVESI